MEWLNGTFYVLFFFCDFKQLSKLFIERTVYCSINASIQSLMQPPCSQGAGQPSWNQEDTRLIYFRFSETRKISCNAQGHFLLEASPEISIFSLISALSKKKRSVAWGKARPFPLNSRIVSQLVKAADLTEWLTTDIFTWGLFQLLSKMTGQLEAYALFRYLIPQLIISH